MMKRHKNRRNQPPLALSHEKTEKPLSCINKPDMKKSPFRVAGFDSTPTGGL
jgi:hypothetical protein